MGQQANSGRNASLDDRKRRAAGRDDRSPEQEAIEDAAGLEPGKGRTGGAFGQEGHLNREGGVGTQGGGGGGGEPAPAKDSHLTTPPKHD